MPFLFWEREGGFKHTLNSARQENVIKESENMIPRTREQLENAIADLKALLVSQNEYTHIYIYIFVCVHVH